MSWIRLMYTIDRMIEQQLAAITAHSLWQQLARDWQTLHWLSHNIDHDEIQIKMLSISEGEVCDDIKQYQCDNTCFLWDKLHTEELATPGGHPFGLLLCQFDWHQGWQSLIRPWQQLLAASFVACLHPLPDLSVSQPPVTVSHCDSLYIVAGRWRMLHELYHLPMNASVIVAYFMAVSVQETGFFMACRQQRLNHSIVEPLLQEHEAYPFIRQGINVIHQHRYSGEVRVLSLQSISGATQYQLNHQLDFLLCAYRFAQITQIMLRHKIGSQLTANECQQQIAQWLHSFCAQRDENHPQALEQPLQAAQIQIKPPATPATHFSFELNVQPHCPIFHVSTFIQVKSL